MEIFTHHNSQQLGSGLKVVISVLVGFLVLGLGISSTRTSTAAEPASKPKSGRQNAATPSIAPSAAAELKTVSFPTKNPQITFQISKDATPVVNDDTTSCFKYGFVVCVSVNLEQTSTFEDNQIKEAEEQLTKQLTVAMTGVLQKEHDATDVHINRTGHFKTAKDALIFFTEASYKTPQKTEMICLNHILASKKGMFVFQGYARETEKGAFFEEMRRLLDSVSL